MSLSTRLIADEQDELTYHDINGWIQNQLGSSPKDGESTLRSLRHFIGSRLSDFCKRQKVTPAIMSVRTAHSQGSPLLRPVFCFPENLYAYFGTPDKQAIGFINDDIDPFGDPSACIWRNICHGRDGSNPIHAALYDITHIIKHYDTLKQDQSSSCKPAPERILRFIEEMFLAQPEKQNFINEIGKYCLVVGEIEPENIDYKGKRFKHFLCIYFDRKFAFPVESIELEIFDLAKQIFSDISVVMKLDHALFKSEGLAMIASLAPLFQDALVAPSDKISFSLQQLKKLLSRHLIGVDYSKITKESRTPSVYFIETKFKRNSENPHALLPEFQIFPQVYRSEMPVGAFLIAHPRSPSVVKYLIHRYFHEVEVVLPEDQRSAFEAEPDRPIFEYKLDGTFQQLFGDQHEIVTETDSLKPFLQSDMTYNEHFARNVRDQLSSYQERRIDDLKRRRYQPDELRITVGDGQELWTYLNKDVSLDDAPRQSMVAFIVEGAGLYTPDIRQRKLPRGVITVESSQAEAFSSKDINSHYWQHNEN